MTEAGRHSKEIGRHSRWTVAALLAPASAAVFAGAMGWSADHQPVTSAANASFSQKGGDHKDDGKHDEGDEALQRQVEAQIAQVRAMRRQVAAMRKEVAALKSGKPTKPTKPTTPGTTTTQPAPAPKPTTPTQTQTSAPAPAPAPPTQTTTGGS